VRLSVDDFGTGYSRLDVLGAEAVDEVKIDRSFDLDHGHKSDESKRDLPLGHRAWRRAFHLDVVARGHRRRTPWRCLPPAFARCHLVQGFLYSKPVPVHRHRDQLNRTVYGDEIWHPVPQPREIRPRLPPSPR